MTYYVYIVASASRVLYIGITNDLERRVLQHQRGEVRAAIAREKQLKGWRRSKKIALIQSLNPRWNDLSKSLRDLPLERKTG